MRKTSFFFLSSLLAACTTAPQKDTTQWKVKTSTESDQKIWVTKADGSRQCAKGKRLNPEKAAEQLKAAGILVFQSRSGNDGMMHAQKCGAPTGGTVDLEISRRDLTRALQSGYVTKTASE